MADYRVKLVTRAAGFPSVELTNAIPGKPYRELNTWGSFDFQIPVLDDQAPAVIDGVLKKEIQVFRDGVCIWWGVPVNARASTDWLTVGCYGLEWYYSRLLFGPLTLNYADPNSGFESGLTGWTAHACTAAADTAWKAKGVQSAKLTNATPDADAYLGRQINVSGHADQPVAYRAAAVYRINPSATWRGTAYGERGLYLGRYRNGVEQTPVWEPITNLSPRLGAEVFVESPEQSVDAGETHTLDLRLYAPAATGGHAISWDLVAIRIQESVSAAIGGDDVATLIGRIITYAHTKWDLMMGFSSTATGVNVFRAFQFYDAGNVWSAISDFVADGICDVGVVWNSNGTQRTFTVWPKRGTARSIVLDLAEAGPVAAMAYDIDGTQTATQVRALGLGSGATREFGVAVDTTATGGAVFESTVNTPVETLVGQLDGLAKTELARTRRPVKMPKLTTHEGAGALIGVLDLGDTVTVSIDHGAVQENDVRRIVALSIDPASETLEPTVNQ